MGEITIYNQPQLPSTLDDLTKFVLVGREKLTSVRAEIRAIDKLDLAQEVRQQKVDEARMLSEALLDAEVRLGELLKEIPKAQGARSDIELTDTNGGKLNKLKKSKAEIVKDLGFSEKQKERFETLADNRDIVEQVKEEARQNDDLPTRSRVLDLAKKRKEADELAKKREQEEEIDPRPLEIREFDEHIDRCFKKSKEFDDVLVRLDILEVSDQDLSDWSEFIDSKQRIAELTEYADNALSKIIKIRKFLRGLKK